MEFLDVENVEDVEEAYSGPQTEMLLYTFPSFCTDNDKNQSLVVFPWDAYVYSVELDFAIESVEILIECPEGFEPTEVSCAFKIKKQDGTESILVLTDEVIHCDNEIKSYDISDNPDEIYDSYDFDCSREDFNSELYL